MHYQATIAYDGSSYHGFQRQRAGVPTVQAAFEDALTQVTGKGGLQILAAGRTDAGVHAIGQVVAFSLLDWRHGPEALQRALNATLPTTIAVWALSETHADFHPRFDARSRTYRYLIYSAPVHHPMERLRAWHVRETLDLAAMRTSTEALIGEHDFSTFGTPPQGEATVRRVYRAMWETYSDSQEGGMFYAFIIEANAFLYRMVRTLCATLREVGAGRMTGATFHGILAARDRSLAAAAAPAHGLTLISVSY